MPKIKTNRGAAKRFKQRDQVKSSETRRLQIIFLQKRAQKGKGVFVNQR